MKGLKYTVCSVTEVDDSLYVVRRYATFSSEKDAEEYALRKNANVVLTDHIAKDKSIRWFGIINN